jgi:hypothetical protein
VFRLVVELFEHLSFYPKRCCNWWRKLFQRNLRLFFSTQNLVLLETSKHFPVRKGCCIEGNKFLKNLGILWTKSFSNNPRWRLKHVFSFLPPYWNFWITFLPQNLCLTYTKWMQKKDWKNVGCSQLCENIWFWSAILDRPAIFDSFDKICSWFMLLTIIQTHCRKQNVKILKNS